MRFPCFFSKRGENLLDFVYKRLKVEFLPPEDNFGGLGIEKAKHVDGIKANNGPALGTNVLVSVIVPL